MNKKNIKRGIICLLISILFIVGLINDKIGNIFGFVIGGLLLLLLSIIISINTISHLIHAYKGRKWYGIVAVSVAIIGVVISILSAISLFWSVPFEDLYEVEEVNVMKVRSNKLIIEYTKYNKDDYKVIEIHKPFYAQVKEGDTISVIYPENHPEKMHYIIEQDKKLIGIFIGSSIFFIGIILTGIVVFIDRIVNKKR